MQLAYRLSRDFGLLDDANLTIVPPVTMPEGAAGQPPSAEFIEAVQQETEGVHGLGTDDVPTFPTCTNTRVGLRGDVGGDPGRLPRGGRPRVNFAGGLHHAMPDRASGFCVYNDVATSIKWLLDQGVERVAYVDVDVHHGDGVQQHFWDDPRVLTISLHESPRTLFLEPVGPPRSGAPAPREPPSTWRFRPARRQRVAARVRCDRAGGAEGFEPQYLVSQQGCDSHFRTRWRTCR